MANTSSVLTKKFTLPLCVVLARKETCWYFVERGVFDFVLGIEVKSHMSVINKNNLNRTTNLQPNADSESWRTKINNWYLWRRVFSFVEYLVIMRHCYWLSYRMMSPVILLVERVFLRVYTTSPTTFALCGAAVQIASVCVQTPTQWMWPNTLHLLKLAQFLMAS